MVSEDEYLKAAPQELAWLVEAVDDLGSDDLEAELESDIVTLEFSDGTKYVINSHRAARQIWMAAERSAWHYDYHPDTGVWLDDKAGEELWTVVNRVIRNKLPSAEPLQRPAG